MRPQDLLRRLAPRVEGITIGTEAGNPKRIISLPAESLLRNVSLEGETGQGKTGLIQELNYSYPFSPMSMINMDYIGTGFDSSKRFVALTATMLQMFERLYPELLAGSASWYLGRHAFATISHREESDVLFDILKRRRRPDGTLESVAEVVDRIVSVFVLRFKDMEIRVKFRRVGTAVFAALIAGGRSITESWRLLTDSQFRAFVLEEIRLRRADTDPFVIEQIQRLLGICGMKPRDFLDETNSFERAVADYGPGTLLGKVFGSEETFDLRRCVFDDARLFVTTDLPNPLHRREAFLALHAINNSLFTLRRAGTGEYNRCFYILDECVQWAHEDITTLLAMGRNLKVSTFLLFQSIAQWRQAGFRDFPDILPSVCRLRGVWRPTTFESARDLAVRTRRFDPMGMTFLRALESVAEGNSVVDTLSDSWSDTISHAAGLSQQELSNIGASTSANESVDAKGAPNGSAKGSGSSTTKGRSEGSSTNDALAHLAGGSAAHAIGYSRMKTLAETLIRVATSEQIDLDAMDLLRQPEHRATFLYQGKSITANMYPPREYPRELPGLPLDALYADWHRRHYTGCAESRTPFTVAPIVMSSGAVPASAVPPTATAPPKAPADPAPSGAAAPLECVVMGAYPVLPIDGAARTIRILQVAAVQRFVTVNHLIALTGWTYDKAYRELDACAEATPPLLDRIKPFAPRGEGSAPTIYILATAGARLLAAHGGDERELLRIAKNGADHRRAVEQALPTHNRHRLYTATLLAFLAAGAQRAGWRSIDVKADREVVVKIDFAKYAAAMTDRDRAALCPDPANRTNRYVPDASFSITGDDGGARYVVEIETGFSERDERELARVKAWKIRALADAQPDMPGVLVWLRTPELEERFIEGAAPVLGEAATYVRTTNGVALPLATPPGVNKRERAKSVSAVAAAAAGPVWRSLGDATGARSALFG